MINEIINMNGYGSYVWSAFGFTILSFSILYLVIRSQYLKEKSKFVAKFGALDLKKSEAAKSQTIIKEILSSSQSI